MLSLNKLPNGNGSFAFVVSCELSDGNDRRIVKSRRFDCSGGDDLGAQTDAVRFARTTDTVPEFRAFLFGESDGSGRDDKRAVDKTGGVRPSVQQSQSVSQRFRIRSYVCMREKPLSGVRYAVAMCRLESGQLRSISFFRGSSLDDDADGRGEKQVIGKAVQFLRSVAFESWRRQVSRESGSRSREQSVGSHHNPGKERGLKHPHSFVEMEQGEKVDCVCGKNRSHGLMMACERCGAWEHAECQGFRSNKQIPADYICSACVRAEREEVTVIRCEEQGKYWSVDSEDTHSGMTVREQEDRRPVCCLCGCEDNEYFEPLVQPCGCVGCSVLAHTSCIATVKGGGSHREQRLERLGVCCFCGKSVKDGVGSDAKLQRGGRWIEEARDSGNSKLVKGDHLGVARKRLKATSAGGPVPIKVEHGEKASAKSSKNEISPRTVNLDKVQPEASPTDLKKSPLPFLGRRFSDAAANVPIKKRRIQLEMARSPSPPPGSITAQPDIPAVHGVLEATKSSCSQTVEKVSKTVANELDGVVGASTGSFSVAHVQKFDSEAPATALNIREEDLMKRDGQSNHAVPSDRMCREVEAAVLSVSTPGTRTDGGILVGNSTQMRRLDSVAGCKSEKIERESQQRKGNGGVTENGIAHGANRMKEERSMASHVGSQQQQIPAAHAGSVISVRGREQACAAESAAMSEHLRSSGLSKTGHAGGQSEDLPLDSGKEGMRIPSPSSKRKYSETDMGSPLRHHTGLEESGRSRSGRRAEKQDFGTSVAASGAENVRALVLHEQAMTEASTVGGKDNSRDDRLHWDLNMDIEEWERRPEEEMAVSTAENLAVIAKNGAEERESFHLKGRVQEPEEGESGATVSVSAGFENGRREQNRPPQDKVDGIRKVNAAEDRGGSLEAGMQGVREDEASLMPSGSCNASPKVVEGQVRETFSSIFTSGGVVGTVVDKHHDNVEDESLRVRDSLPREGPTAVLQEDITCREPEIATPIDHEAEVLRSEKPASVAGPSIDKDTMKKVSVVAGKDITDLDCRSSVVTDMRASTACVHEQKDISGTSSVKEVPDSSSDAVDVLRSGKQPVHCGEVLSQVEHPEEEVMVSAQEPSSGFSAAKMSCTRTDTGTQGCDEEEGAPEDDENLVEKEVVEELMMDKKQSSTSPSRQPTSTRWEGDNGEDPEAEDVDYGDSDMREGDDVEVEDRSQRGASEVESTWNPHGDVKVSEVQGASASEGLRADADDYRNVVDSCGVTKERRQESEISGAEELQRMDVNGGTPAVEVEDPNYDSIPGKSTTNAEIDRIMAVDEKKVEDEQGIRSASIATSDSQRTSLERAEDLSGIARSGNVTRRSEVWRESSEGGGRVRTKSGWDQLPVGFQSAEEALQAARSNAGQAGWGSHYGSGYSGWNGNPNMHFGDNRYLSGHGRGILMGPTGDRGAFDKTAWSRGDHPRRSRLEDGLETHVRVPVNQELRQSSGGRAARPSSLEPAHRQRRRGVWGDDTGGGPPMWAYGPGRPLSPPGLSREAFRFHPHKTRNAAAVAAAKVESSGLVVAPDGTVIKAGVGAHAPLRGPGGKGRGGGFSSIGDMSSNGLVSGVGNTGLSHSLRIGDVDLRGRDCLGVDARIAGGMGMGAHCADPPLRFKGVGERFGAPNFPHGGGSPMARGAPGMLGTSSRFKWTRGEGSFVPPVEQEERISYPGKHRPLDTGSLPQPRSRSRLSTPPGSMRSNEAIPDDGAACESRKSRGAHVTDTKAEAESEVAPEELQASALQVVALPPKLPLPPPPSRAQRSPRAGLKRLTSKREVDWPRGRERSRDKERECDRERIGSRGHYSPSRRSSPHVIHGSSLTDERDRLLLAGIDKSTRDQCGASVSVFTEDATASHSHRGRSTEGTDPEGRRNQHYDGRKQDADVHLAQNGVDLPFSSRTQCKDSSGAVRGGDWKDSRSETRAVAGRGGSGTRSQDSSRREYGQKVGSVSYKQSSSREGEDDVAPRRRRPS